MKKRIVILVIALSVLLTSGALFIDFHTYKNASREISYQNSGIVFTISTFDGKNEAQPFVPCLGHAWISIENHLDHPILVRDYAVEPGETLAMSAWSVSGHFGVTYNLEPNFIRECGRYVGRQSVSVNIDESQLDTVNDYIKNNNRWGLTRNCTYWSIHLWNAVVGDKYPMQTQTLLYTPERLERSFAEYTNVEIDKDFSRAKGIFLYDNGKRTELSLCP